MTPVPPSPLAVEPPVGMAIDDQVYPFRELRTRLLAIAADRQIARFTTLIVPLVSGSGGSFVARNLAAAFTFQGESSALIIDCNMDHPSQHAALRTGDDGGLFEFLDEPHVRFAPKLTGLRGLYLIPAGRPRSQFREYFSSNKMRGLMRVIRESGHFVFLDGPPVKGSPDARILSEDVAQAVAMFEPAKIVGVVFNEQG
jgi:Mrp family chromosome partitioning ATPase